MSCEFCNITSDSENFKIIPLDFKHRHREIETTLFKDEEWYVDTTEIVDNAEVILSTYRIYYCPFCGTKLI